jgi:hypothetical protein
MSGVTGGERPVLRPPTEDAAMKDCAEVAVTLPVQVLDRLRREALVVNLPLPWLVAAFVAALVDLDLPTS